MLPLHQKERYKYYGIEYRMPVKDMAAAAKVSLRFQKDVLKLHGLGYEAAIAAGWTMRLAIVLVPSYVAAYLTGEMVWVVPTLVASGLVAAGVNSKTPTTRVDEDGDNGDDGDDGDDGQDDTGDS